MPLQTLPTRKPNPVIAAIDAGHFFKDEKKGTLACRECKNEWPCPTIVEARRANRAQYLTLQAAGSPKTIAPALVK